MTKPEIENLITFITIYGTIILIVLVIAIIIFFIGMYQAKVNEDKLNDLFTKIDHTKNYKK